MLIALRACFGQDEVSHGTKRYRVGFDHLVIVPPMVAVYLTRNAGFEAVGAAGSALGRSMAADVAPQPLVRMRHPTAIGCSYGGREYCCNQDGEFLVPAAAVAELLDHGFTAVEPASPILRNSGANPAWLSAEPSPERRRHRE